MRRCYEVVILLIMLTACSETDDRFKLLSSEVTGLDFNNRIVESDTFNILTYEYIYNGGGVAIADFNNDGLPDIYFTGNMVSNEMYLNKGNLKFQKVTHDAGVDGLNRWSSGVAVADLNADGYPDIYICVTANQDSLQRRNILYISKGLNMNGIPTFENLAWQYNLDDAGHSTCAAFFDYDKDGDLDLYLAMNKMTKGSTANVYRSNENFSERVDKLYRNDFDTLLKHPVFHDVSKEAGIIHDGYSLGVNVSDIDQDGWSDIYVTNDYLTTDLVYINNHDGTFSEKSKQFFKHTSHSAMGNDVVDLNNDGRPEVIAVDMMPEDNFRKKTMLGQNNYTTYINNEKYQYQYQYGRNTLQLNQGNDPHTGEVIFSEVGLYAGISSTDWSWTPLVADFDNDGFRDIIITNGFPRDVTDRDFIDYYAHAGNYASKMSLMQRMPSVKIRNYAFRNMGDCVFEDVTDAWGIRQPSFSNGAAYADLDNDGDLDYVVNNINDQAFLYENLTNKKETQDHNWIRVQLQGYPQNVNAFGTKVNVYQNGKRLYADQTPYRGYLSTVESILHFGVGNASQVDSLIVEWPNGNISRNYNSKSNQLLTLNIEDSKPRSIQQTTVTKPLFEDISKSFSAYRHRDEDFIDFNIQPLLLHKLSQFGPGLAVGDINGDKLDDIYLSGSRSEKGSVLLQSSNGVFSKAEVMSALETGDNLKEELGVLLFDADRDGDNDLYTVSGGYEHSISDSSYRHSFYRNEKGRFSRLKDALPDFLLSGSCVRAADYDRDGDLDLFVAGRVLPHQYPLPVNSYLLVNQSDGTAIKFEITDGASQKQFNNAGLVCDALWTDFDNDGWVDLVLAGEWMPVRFYKNYSGRLSELGKSSGVNDSIGWWNSIAAADFDNDGDIDYIAGNVGENTLIKPKKSEPISVYAKDFDKNDRLDMIPSAYFKNREGKNEEFSYFGRLDVQKELIRTKRQYLKHADFAVTNMDKLVPPDQRQGALIYKANYFSSSLIENKGGGSFSMRRLPSGLQIAPLYGILTQDINNDANADLIIVGNDFGPEVATGRYDAFNGEVLLGDGNGSFKQLSVEESGFYVPGDAKGLSSILREDGRYTVVATTNNGPISAFQTTLPCKKVESLRDDVFRVEFLFDNGAKSVMEVYYGNGFISQSSRKICIPENVTKVRLITYTGSQSTLDVN